MATTTRLPNLTESAQWNRSGCPTAYQCVDEGVDAHDSGATNNTTSSSGNRDNLEIEDMPGDFDTAIDYQIRVVSLQAGRVDDEVIVETNIRDADIAIDANVDSHNLDAVTSYAILNGTARSNSDNAAAWDSYEVAYRSLQNASGMPDAVTWRVTAVEVVINYTATGGPSATITGVVATAEAAALFDSITSVEIVSVVGVEATATAAAPLGAVEISTSIVGVEATATALAPVGVITATSSATITGVEATADAVAPIGVISTVRIVSVSGEPATADAVAPIGVVTSVSVVSVAGVTALAEAEALLGVITALQAGDVMIIGEVAEADAEALIGVITAIEVGAAGGSRLTLLGVS